MRTGRICKNIVCFSVPGHYFYVLYSVVIRDHIMKGRVKLIAFLAVLLGCMILDIVEMIKRTASYTQTPLFYSLAIGGYMILWKSSFLISSTSHVIL